MILGTSGIMLHGPTPGTALAFSRMMAQTIGLGLRYNTFFGALRVDWGFKLYDPSGQFNPFNSPPGVNANNSPSAITPGVTGGWLFRAQNSLAWQYQQYPFWDRSGILTF